MKYKLLLIVSLLFLIYINPSFGLSYNIWHIISNQETPKNFQVMHPNHFMIYQLDESVLKMELRNISNNPNEATTISLPLPDGSYRNFKVWQTTMMPPTLSAQFPEIKTFTGEAIGNSSITAKLDFTDYGFHAMIFNGANTSFIDPFDRYNDGYYMIHYMKDETRTPLERMTCLVDENNNTSGHIIQPMETIIKNVKENAKTFNGYQLRTYRLALACGSLYAQAVTGLIAPTVPQTFSCMTTTMNRINGVYEREFAITMTFIANESQLIFTTSAGDPYFADNNNASNLLTDNQTECDNIIGNANYDIGHVFTTGSGGLSQVGCVCQAGSKASSTTGQPTPVGDGFDINYVAHEMGHEFGSDHTFNDNLDGSCNSNAVANFAYEPGSGTTIMCYAGICSPDDLQANSDAYFSGSSLLQIQSYITTTNGDVCAVHTPTANFQVYVPPFAQKFSIPYKTPFELIAPEVTDSVPDTATLYCWEECDLGDFGQTFYNTQNYGPLFRSFSPTPNATRVFPTNSMVMAGTLSNAGIENAQGEKVPVVARNLIFKLTMRDILHGNGIFTALDDTILINVVGNPSGGGFTLASQASAGIVYNGGSLQTIVWNIAGTNAEPVNTSFVDIYMSVDNGNTWGYNLGTFENNGAANVTVPNPPTTTSQARFKVKGTGNVFFNVNTTPFTVNYDVAKPISNEVAQVNNTLENILLYPIPATNILHVATYNNTIIDAQIYNMFGEMVWVGKLNGQTNIDIANKAKGVYYLLGIDNNKERVIKKFIVE